MALFNLDTSKQQLRPRFLFSFSLTIISNEECILHIFENAPSLVSHPYSLCHNGSMQPFIHGMMKGNFKIGSVLKANSPLMSSY
jgi:hypothetical protein